MLAKLEMKLGETELMSYQMSSLFHGMLMELISEDYAEKLHESRLHPYSQHLEKRNNEWYWIVNTLNDEAKNEIIIKALLPADRILIKKKDLELKVIEKRYTELPDSELASFFYNEQGKRYITIRFVTATAFKNEGRYINYPDIGMIYSNLMNKYSASSNEESMRDDETLEQLISNTEINRYELRSTLFSLEGVRIPAFIGSITFRIKGTQTMCNFANMLFRFGTYSGIGIKTSIGMGAITITEQRAAR